MKMALIYSVTIMRRCRFLCASALIKCKFKQGIKKIVIGAILWIVLYIIYLQWRISTMSHLKDIVELKALDLNNELKSLPHFKESLDLWKTPDLKDSRIFSAYLETRSEVVLEENCNLIYNDSTWAFIRIIAIMPVNLTSSELMCYYKFRHDSGKLMYSYITKKPFIKSQLVAANENFGMFYSAAYILCPLPFPEEASYDDKIKLPYKITVSINPDRKTTEINDDEFVIIRYPENGWNFVNVKNKNIVLNTLESNYDKSNSYNNNNKNNNTRTTKNEDNIDKKKLFSVCVQPLHHEFDKVIDLISFIEFYKMMGVRRFTFYRDSVTNDVDSVLNYYANDGIAIVLQWKLPKFYIFERNLRVDGIYAALNDCLYRNTYHVGFEYVAGVDIDEYIVPRIHNNFQNMMEYLNPPNTPRQTGAWIFRNAFYYMIYNDDTVTLSPELPKLNFHIKTRRWVQVNPPYDRSKYIVRGNDVIELGNHRIWRTKRTWSLFGRYEEEIVDPTIGTSNHYRYCETEIETCWRRQTIVDRAAHRFSKELSVRVSNLLKELKIQTNIIN